jgi:hypothetical protein
MQINKESSLQGSTDDKHGKFIMETPKIFHVKEVEKCRKTQLSRT